MNTITKDEPNNQAHNKQSNDKPVAVITGGASGLGRALALKFSASGWNIVIADLNADRGQLTLDEVTANGAEAIYCHCDVRSFADLEQCKNQTLAKFNRVDAIINNAGVASSGRFERVSLETWDWMLDINLMGVVRGCKSFVPEFKKQGHGHIVNVASMAGLMVPPGMAEYNVAKAGVIALSETLRAELQPYGINTTVVCPSFFKTNLGESLRTADNIDAENFGRLMETSEITADDIAIEIFQAMEDKRFWVLPHEKAKIAWDLKQANPEAFFAQNLKIGESLHRKDPGEKADKD